MRRACDYNLRKVFGQLRTPKAGIIFWAPIMPSDGNVIRDVVGGKNVPLTGGSIVKSDPILGAGLYPSNSEVYVSGTNFTNATTFITMSFFANWTGNSSSICMYNGDSSKDGYGIYTGSTGSPSNRIQILIGGVAYNALNGYATFDVGLNHVCIKRNATTWYLYKNGVYTGYNGSTSPKAPSMLYLASASMSPIADCRFYNRELTDQEIFELSNPAVYWELLSNHHRLLV